MRVKTRITHQKDSPLHSSDPCSPITKLRTGNFLCQRMASAQSCKIEKSWYWIRKLLWRWWLFLQSCCQLASGKRGKPILCHINIGFVLIDEIMLVKTSCQDWYINHTWLVNSLLIRYQGSISCNQKAIWCIWCRLVPGTRLWLEK